MQKIFIENKQVQDNKINITGEDVKHISNVLRMKPNDKIEVSNIENNKNYLVEIEEIKKDIIVTSIIEEKEQVNESNVKIDLYQGLPKADKMELIIQKTIEVGISKIIPVDMARCIVKLDEKEAVKKIQRWQKIALEAAKQSKRDIIPKIENKVKLDKVLHAIKEYDLFLVAYEEEKENILKEELKKLPKKDIYNIAILIGPEGGLELQEVEKLKENGAKIVSLGKRILRTETAPIVMSSNIIYELEK